MQALAILDEVGGPELVARAAPLLRHGHAKVRTAAIRVLGKAGGEEAAKALAAAIASGDHGDEAKLAATSLSLITGVEADKKLLAAYRANDSYETRVAIVTALSRCGTHEVEAFLVAVTKQTFMEWLKGLFGWLTGAPKDLREAALHALEDVRKELRGAKG
ncbi:MAG: HEAT repeat domain-containing protein [Elusimicrobia bacterium]|nr:HEAT repeat domain-containing protein [Elusimicrobiota bacterium]